MLFTLVGSSFVTLLLVLLPVCLYLFNQTSAHHPSLLSLSLPHEMAASWPIQGVSYCSAAVASGLNQSIQELAGKNVGMEGTSETDIPSPLHEIYTNKLEPLLSRGGMSRQTF